MQRDARVWTIGRGGAYAHLTPAPARHVISEAIANWNQV